MEGAPQISGARATSFHDAGYLFSQQQQGQHAGNDPQRRNLMNHSSMSSPYDNQSGSYPDSAHMGQQGRWSQNWSGASAHGSGASMGPISVPAGAVPAGFNQFDSSPASPPIPALLPNYGQPQQVSPRPAPNGTPPGMPGPQTGPGVYGGPSAGGGAAAGGGHEHMHAYGSSGGDALAMHAAGSAGALSAQQLAGALRVGATKEDRLGLSRREFKRLLRAEVQAGMPIDPSYAHHPHDQASASPRMIGPGVGAGMRISSGASPLGSSAGPDGRARLHLGNVQQQHPGIASAQSSGRSSGSGSPHDMPVGPYGGASGTPSHLHQSWGSAPNTARGGGAEQQGQYSGQQHYGSFYGQGPAQGGGVNWSTPSPTPVSTPEHARPSPRDAASEAIAGLDGGSKSTSGYGALLSRNGQDVPSASFAPTARAIDSQMATSLSRLGLQPPVPPTQTGRMPDASMAGSHAAATAKGSGDAMQSVRHLLPSSLMNLDGDSIAPAPAFGTGYLSLSSTGGTSQQQQGFLVLDKLPGSFQLGTGSASMPLADSLARVQSTDSGWSRLSTAADGSDVSKTVAYKASGGEESGDSARTDGVTGQVSLTSHSSDSNASAGAPASAPGTGDSAQDKSAGLNSVPTSTRGLSLPGGSHHGVSSAVSNSTDNSGNSSDKERARLIATLSSSEEASSGSGGGDGQKSTAPPSPVVENPGPGHAQEVVATGSGSDYSVAALQGGLLASMSAEGQLAVVRATLHDMVERETRDLRRKLAESDAAHGETKAVLQFVLTKLEMAVTRIEQLESKAVQLLETSPAADATAQVQA